MIFEIKNELVHCFAMKDLGLLSYFFGTEVACSPKVYLLSQSKYITYIFERAWISGNKIVNTPLELNA